MLTKEQVSGILLDTDAVRISRTSPFRYASGMLSPIYTDCRVLASHIHERNSIIETMHEQVGVLEGKFDIIASAGTASIFLASLLSERLGLPMIYIRPSPKKHGKRKEIEGVFKPGDRVLLVSDIISTEESIPSSVDTIQKSGGLVVHCLAVFNNNMGKVEGFLRAKGIPYSYLSDLTTLLETAKSRHKFSDEQISMVQDWLKDPERWDTERQKRLTDLLDDIKIRVAGILLEIKAVSINAEEPFKYTSGLLSPIYTDNRLLISYPEKWHFIIDSFINVILNIVGLENIDVVAGTATSGIPHAALISDKLALPLVYVKIGENGNGHGTIEGRMGNESRAVMVEDHITTGKSVISAVETLRAAGARVDWCTAIFTYGSQVSKDKFKEAKLDLITLCDLATLLKVAVDLKHITEKDRDTVLEWLDNPESWSNKRQST